MSEGTSILILIVSMLLFTIFAVFTILYIALQKKKQYRNHLEKQDMLHRFGNELMQSRLEMQEQTMKHFSLELHDNVAQLLGMAKMQASLMRDNANDNWKEMGQETVAMIGEAIEGIRSMSHVMSGSYILRNGFSESVKKEAERTTSATGVKCNFIEEGELQPLGEDKELLLFRMVQESIANAVKHGAASQITITATCTPQHLQVSVADNGKGFDNTQHESKGIGLSNIEARAAMLHGQTCITTSPGNGTIIQISIPLTNNA